MEIIWNLTQKNSSHIQNYIMSLSDQPACCRKPGKCTLASWVYLQSGQECFLYICLFGSMLCRRPYGSIYIDYTVNSGYSLIILQVTLWFIPESECVMCDANCVAALFFLGSGNMFCSCSSWLKQVTHAGMQQCGGMEAEAPAWLKHMACLYKIKKKQEKEK